MAEKKFDVLLEAQWLPAPAGTFDDRPASPERLAAASSTANASPVKPAAYRPPSLRDHLAQGAGGAPSANFSLAYDASVKQGRISTATASAAGGTPLPPGAEFVSKAAAKNAKKRAAKKAAGGKGDDEGDERAGGSAPAAAAPAAGPSSRAAANGAASQGAGAAAAQGMAGLSVGESAADTQKRIRALQKKLRQIEQLKEKRAQEGGRAGMGC